MPQLSLDCPHCQTEKAAFTPRQTCQINPGLSQSLLFSQCEVCGQGIIAVVPLPFTNVQQWINGSTSSLGQILKIFPEKLERKVPPDVPPSVASAYLSGLDNLGRKNGANAAAIMFRRSIEIATKVIPEALNSGNLQKRIEALPLNIATPAMKEWAHHIRLDANEATHDVEEFTEEDAKKLQLFAEMFLTYAFTLPAMMKRAKGEPS